MLDALIDWLIVLVPLRVWLAILGLIAFVVGSIWLFFAIHG